MSNTETTQFFNYKVLTDSVTNEQFYCINNKELVALVQENTKEVQTTNFNLGYRSGCMAGMLYMIFAYFMFKLVVRILKHKAEQIENNKD